MTPSVVQRKPWVSSRMRRWLGRLGRGLFWSLPLIFLAVCFLYPLGIMLWWALDNNMAGLRTALSANSTWRILNFTVAQALLSTGLTLLLGMPAAYVFAHYTFWGRRWLEAIAALPFVMPAIVVATAFESYLGEQGLLRQLVRALLGSNDPLRPLPPLLLIVLAHIFYNYTVVIRLVGGLWAGLDPRQEEAARMLGAGRWRVLWRVTLPRLLPAIGAAALLIFIFTFTSFGVILILGGVRFATIEVAIYRNVSEFLALDVAAALATIQLVCALLCSVASAWLSARSSVPLDLLPPVAVARRPHTWAAKLAVWLTALAIIGLLGGPLLSLMLRSLGVGTGEVTLRYYAALQENRTDSAFFVPPSVAVWNSVRAASVTVLIALAVGVPAAYLLTRRNPKRRRLARLGDATLDALFMLPLGASPTTLGLGFLVGMSTPALASLRTSPWIIPVLHALVALPFVIRGLLPVLRGRNPRLREAAAALGAAPWRVWLRVDLPLMLPALMTSAIFAFTVSLGEFGATLFVTRPDQPTIPTMIYRFLGQPGTLNYYQALALSTILMLITMLAFLLGEKVAASDAISREREGQADQRS